MTGKRDADWIEVASTGNDEEAELISGLLRSEEIPNVIEGPSGGSPWPENLGAFGMSRVLVPPERADEARALLESRQRDYSGGAADEDPNAR